MHYTPLALQTMLPTVVDINIYEGKTCKAETLANFTCANFTDLVQT